MWRACGHCSQRLCLCTLQSRLLFAEQFCVVPKQLWANTNASSLTLRCDTPHTIPCKLHECSSDDQVQACSQLIGPGLSPGVITVTGHVTRHPQLSIFHAKYTPSPSLQQPPKQDDHYSPVLSCHSVVARHISSRPDLGLLEIPRIKIHFRLHFLF